MRAASLSARVPGRQSQPVRRVRQRRLGHIALRALRISAVVLLRGAGRHVRLFRDRSPSTPVYTRSLSEGAAQSACPAGGVSDAAVPRCQIPSRTPWRMAAKNGPSRSGELSSRVMARSTPAAIAAMCSGSGSGWCCMVATDL